MSTFPDDWGRKCKLTIQASKVSGALTDFPVLVTKDTLPSEIFDSDGSNPAQSDAGDVRFTSDSAGTTQLACEVVEFTTDADPANGTAEIWVKVPSISSSVDTDIWIWYNTAASDSQPSASDTYGSENVWDSNFKVVAHLESDASDSTSNSNDGTVSGASTATAKIGGGYDFDGTNDSIDFGTPLGASALQDIDYSYEIWAEADDTSGTQFIIGNANYSGTYGDGIDFSGTTLRWYKEEGGAAATGTATTTMKHLAGTYNKTSNTLTLYVDGASVDTASSTKTDAGGTIQIGGDWSNNYFFDGVLDEPRIHDTTRSSDWIYASFNTQSNPGTFIVESSPESTSPAGSNLVSIERRPMRGAMRGAMRP